MATTTIRLRRKPPRTNTSPTPATRFAMPPSTTNRPYSACYADADLAIVVGGYNSSNTSHLVEYLRREIAHLFHQFGGENTIGRRDLHYDFHHKEEKNTSGWLPQRRPVKILISSGASCPDTLVESVIRKLAGYFNAEDALEATMNLFLETE